MPPERRVYLLDPKRLSQETIAVAFAKTSRSPESFKEIAQELSEEKSAEFHEKWVVGYGHSSVAEHAVLHVAIENVSRLAVETLESSRLASFTEKSTRYQKWDPNHFFIPDELEGHLLRERYVSTCRMLFENYLQSLDRLREATALSFPRKEGESEVAWDRRIRTAYVDAGRFYLPACAVSNVGMTVNARELEYAISKMISHPLAEVQALGNELKEVAQREVPTLIKYAHEIPYLVNLGNQLEPSPKLEDTSLPTDWCHIVHSEPDIEERILAAALFRFGFHSYTQYLEAVKGFSLEEKERLIEGLTAEIGRHDQPIREFEHGSFTFEIVLDQGAYAELKRHRMSTQTPQALIPFLGFAVPALIAKAGLEMEYGSAMRQAFDTYQEIAAFNPWVASYVIPNAFNRRVLMTMNLRSACHLIHLRTAPNAHFSIRRIAAKIAEEVQQKVPTFAKPLGIEPQESWQDIERTYFAETMANATMRS